MPLEVSWHDIAIRLLLTVVAGALIGLNREEHGQAAGLRTTLLVCLAASVSMIQMNVLLDVTGKNQSSFAVMDVMRLPLGILSGMGFIGGGVILRKGSIVRGVTTAATLWFVTVMGLCFGGGQIGLGLGALLLGLIVLIGLKHLERHLRQVRQATLTVVAGPIPPSDTELTDAIVAAGYSIATSSVVIGEDAELREMSCEVKWRARDGETGQPAAFMKGLATRFGLAKVDWRVGDKASG